MLLGLRFGGVGAVLLERAREGKLAEAMTDHVFRDENRVENLAVVNVERQPDEIGRDHRATRPGLDRLLRLGFLRLDNFIEQMPIDKRAFFD